ncbi:hypothetical protein B4113_1980 [Geobacillus sp. B4113_201601]|nr:hypothetical protein B4113_1980 [Geobacillus sp. B4113_201601]
MFVSHCFPIFRAVKNRCFPSSMGKCMKNRTDATKFFYL